MESIKKENETYGDIEYEKLDPALNVTEIDKELLTPEGVDPNDPEEIDRINHLKKLMREFGPYWHTNRRKITFNLL